MKGLISTQDGGGISKSYFLPPYFYGFSQCCFSSLSSAELIKLLIHSSESRTIIITRSQTAIAAESASYAQCFTSQTTHSLPYLLASCYCATVPLKPNLCQWFGLITISNCRNRISKQIDFLAFYVWVSQQ